ncbi:MAG: nickel pincer cofactor biosynthesis protein LarB [Anaerolineae bacterium]|nr:MAG: nickel pincer cofactor biosynthesis protein LarB [Anaerolineae bacterium]
MDSEALRALLQSVQHGETSPEEALDRLRSLPLDSHLGYAQLDTHRALRQGLPEVVFCQGKTPQQVSEIMERLWAHHDRVLGTRATPDVASAVQARLPQARYDPVSRLLTLSRAAQPALPEASPYALVLSAGTADIPVAEEAAQTLEFFGSRVRRAYDVGVAGIHRLLQHRAAIDNAAVILSIAGMEGALTSVVGGLAACPVIGVPTSVGYGASFDGLAALLAMLNSCAPGVAVVNIDNGFGAAMMAWKILHPLTQP